MGLFSSKRESRERDERVEQYAREARDEARLAERYRKSLRSGRSDDPAADRYMIRQHEENHRVAQANARDASANAKTVRKWWR